MISCLHKLIKRRHTDRHTNATTYIISRRYKRPAADEYVAASGVDSLKLIRAHK